MNNNEIADVRRSIIKHALGIDNRNNDPYRSYYCAKNGDDVLEEMCVIGLMSRGQTINNNEDRYYFATKSGAEFVGAKLP